MHMNIYIYLAAELHHTHTHTQSCAFKKLMVMPGRNLHWSDSKAAMNSAVLEWEELEVEIVVESLMIEANLIRKGRAST